MPSYVIGLDLSDTAVRATLLKGSLRGYEIVDFLSLEPERDEDTGQATITTVSAAARKVLDTIDRPQATIVTSVSAVSVSSWVVDMPFSDPKRIEQTIRFEIENYVPWDLEEVALDYRIASTSEQGARVLTAMVPWERLEQLVDALHAVEIDPRHIVVDAEALARLAPPSDQAVALLDVDAQRTLVCVTQGGECQWFRAVHRALSPLPEQRPGLLEETTAEVDPSVVSWITDIRASLLAAQRGGCPTIEKVLITGSRARQPGLSQALAEDLGVETHHLVLPASPINPESAPHPEPGHAVCYALALRGFGRKGGQELELRQGEFAYKADSRLYGRLTIAGIAAAILIALTGVGLHLQEVHSLRTEIASVKTQLIDTVQQAFPQVPASVLVSPESAIAVMNEQVNEVQKRIDHLEGPAITPLVALKELSNVVPKDVLIDVDEYLVNGEMIRIRGTTDSFGSVDSIEAAIAAHVHFKGAQKSDVNKARDGKMRFVVTIPRNGEEGEEG
ncbi:MAG: hypothetical protein CL928_02700 [Deltaproteobacteria bacterium]|nr:hypothetical protein [Deltaproteobacteria bacterium]